MKLLVSAIFWAIVLTASSAVAKEKPNILIIWGDDIGFWNPSFINNGMMRYRTPNIDRIANEGIWFTDYYGDQSCTAGRASFITGQHPVRTGLTKVGMPGAKQGLSELDPTIAGLLKPHGYVTAQFGKNHLGDRDEHLPTNHGFDEFFGNLYHLNIEGEPELPDYPTGQIAEKIRPRGVIKSTAGGTIEDSGPLTQKRMETIDEEFVASSIDFMTRAHEQEKPFFLWFNASRMHLYTRLKSESKNVTGVGIYADGLVEHDGHVGQLLDHLDKLGIADNTIVMYSTDNGAEKFTWPDGGNAPFYSEKGTTWEGGVRVPAAVRWPGQIPAGKVVNGIVSHQDWLPTLLAAAGEPDIKEKLLKGHSAMDRDYNVHLDGYNMLDYFKSGGEGDGPRKEFYYFTDVGEFSAIRHGDVKLMFTKQEAHGFDLWKNPYTPLAWPDIINLRADPFESAPHDSIDWPAWALRRMYAISAGALVATDFVKTFVKYPPRQTPGSFNLDSIIANLEGVLEKAPN
jgi:arylsulfatase